MDEHIKAVEKMQEYIKKHLCEEITLSDLANVSLFSPWYARRLFVEYTSYSPSDYIRKLRLRETALKLRDTNKTVVDIAFDYGFKSVDGFQRAFYKEYGCNPKKYSSSPIPLPLFAPYGVKFRYIEKKEREWKNMRKVFIQIVDKPKRNVIIKRGIQADNYIDYCNEVGCDVWGVLTSISSISYEPICMWLPKHMVLPNTSTYVQGVEVEENYQGIIPEGCQMITLPETKYALFQGEPYEEEDYIMAIEEIQEAMQEYDPTLLGYMWDDTMPRIQLEPIGKRGYIEMRAIRKQVSVL